MNGVEFEIWTYCRQGGLKRYESGRPCKHCGSTERYVSNTGCVSCALSRRKTAGGKHFAKKDLQESRTAAKAAGHRYYFDGSKCRRGHVARRFVSTGRCWVCHEDASKKKRESLFSARHQTEEQLSAQMDVPLP